MNEERQKFMSTHPLLARIGRIVDELGVEAWVVGGYVRDYLLGVQDRDIDIVVRGDGIALARAVARRLDIDTVVTFERFGTAMIPVEGGKIEFVGARKETYQPDSRNPDVQAGSLREDLLRRDFTVNAMAVALNAGGSDEVLDPLSGQADLRAKILRTPLNPVQTFEDDPLRILRAFRFASQLGFTIDPQALEAIRTMKQRLSIISQERITDEFLKTLKTPMPSVGLKLMFETEVMHIVFPEIA